MYILQLIMQNNTEVYLTITNRPLFQNTIALILSHRHRKFSKQSRLSINAGELRLTNSLWKAT